MAFEPGGHSLWSCSFRKAHGSSAHSPRILRTTLASRARLLCAIALSALVHERSDTARALTPEVLRALCEGGGPTR